jgi:hypothetical protein
LATPLPTTCSPLRATKNRASGVGEQVVLELSDADPQPVHALDDAGNGLEVFGGGGGVDPHWTKKIRRAGDAFVHRAD